MGTGHFVWIIHTKFFSGLGFIRVFFFDLRLEVPFFNTAKSTYIVKVRFRSNALLRSLKGMKVFIRIYISAWNSYAFFFRPKFIRDFLGPEIHTKWPLSDNMIFLRPLKAFKIAYIWQSICWEWKSLSLSTNTDRQIWLFPLSVGIFRFEIKKK